MKPEDKVGPSPISSGAFPTTQWSMVLHAGAASSTEARAALETLCRNYWYPLYGFVRRHGRSHHEAEDCTQEFLARLLSSENVTHARPERGRFRTFLLTALRNFLTNEWHRAHAAKRGGGQEAVSLDFREAEDRFAHEPMDPNLTPEQAFDRNWAVGMINHALAQLRGEYERTNRGALFDVLVPMIWAHKKESSFAELAAGLGLNAHAFTVALHRLRRRLGEKLREEVAITLQNGSDLDSELHHLIAAVATAQRG